MFPKNFMSFSCLVLTKLVENIFPLVQNHVPSYCYDSTSTFQPITSENEHK